jgi:hypothetical protein
MFALGTGVGEGRGGASLVVSSTHFFPIQIWFFNLFDLSLVVLIMVLLPRQVGSKFLHLFLNRNILRPILKN